MRSSISASCTTTALALYFDGVSLGTAAYTGTIDFHVFFLVDPDVPNNIHDVVLFNQDPSWLGRTSWNQYGGMNLGEIVICSDELTGAALSNMRSYFNRYGLSL